MGSRSVWEGALLRGRVLAHCNVHTHGEWACPAHAVDECIRRHEGWQDGDAAFCQSTLDICCILKKAPMDSLFVAVSASCSKSYVSAFTAGFFPSPRGSCDICFTFHPHGDPATVLSIPAGIPADYVAFRCRTLN